MTFSCSQKKGEYYFDFDQVEHYSIKIDENELFDLEEKKNLTQNQQLKIDIIIDDKPEKISDTAFIPKLAKIGFTKKIVSEKKTR